MRKPYIVKTIVTSELGEKIAEDYGVTCFNTLTGFKFIGEKINQLSKERDFLFGYEESYGYLMGIHARDKDGVSSSLLISEMASYYYSEGESLIDVLNRLYKRYGYYKEELTTLSIKGDNSKVGSLMMYYRELNDEFLKDWGIIKVKDYLNGIDNLPSANVIKFFFNDCSWLAVRPSGTEPKIKFYLGAKGKDENTAFYSLNHIKQFIESTVEK